MWRNIAHPNTEAVERALLALEQSLARLHEDLRTPRLRDEFEQANRFRNTWRRRTPGVSLHLLAVSE
jgi:prephenate dehydrogenase